MSDIPLDNIDLKLILRNTEQASRDALAAMEATERLVISIGARFDALESRAGSLEARMTSLELRITAVEKSVDGIARLMHRTEKALEESNHRIERMLGDIMARLSP